MTITDEPGLKSDKVDIVLSDQNLAIPNIGDLLKISLGYKESGLYDMGTFAVDGYALSHNEMRITAHAADFLESFKNPKSRSFENTSLENILQTISSEHNIEARVSHELANITFPAIHQTSESDLHFLTRLGQQFNILIKPAGSCLVAMPAGHGQAISGTQLANNWLPEVTITPDSTINWSLQYSKKDQIPSVTAKGYDTDSAEEFFETAGEEDYSDSDIGYSLRGLYPTRDAAKTAAKAMYEKLTQKAYTFTAEIPGNPNVLAESRLHLKNFRSEIPTDWIISRSVHTLNSAGYRTSLEAMVPS
jgi:phage protein D